MDKFSICIGRSLGSGGRVVGRRLAERFGMAYFDKEILTLAARESGIAPELFERRDERKGWFRSMISATLPMQSSDFYANQLSDEALFRIQSEAIRGAADERSCVFIGRCADYVLRDRPRVVSVFVCADMEERLQRVMQRMEADEKRALKLIEQGDAARAAYYNFYCNGTWGQASTYDLCINSSRLGIEGTTDFIARFVEARLGGT